MNWTNGEPQRSRAVLAEEGVYPELVYSLRPAGAGEFGPPERICIMDNAYVGRRDAESWFGPEIALPEDDTQTSRFHGVFVVQRAEHLSLIYHDLGSQNGTCLAGEPVTQCPVVAGTCLRLGRGAGRSELRVLGVDPVRPRPDDFWPRSTYGPLRGECAPLRRMFANLDALAVDARASPVVAVRGPDGSGKKAVAWELIRRWEGPALDEVPYVDARWLSADPDPHPLAHHLEREAGVVILDKVHGMSGRQQLALHDWVRDRLHGGRAGRSPRLILLLRPEDPAHDASQPRSRELVKLLRSVPSIRLPGAPICGRDEVEQFARHFLARYQADAPTGCRFQVRRCRLTAEALELLRDEPWPGNWLQLQRVVEMAALGVAIDGREAIEPDDLPLGYSDVDLPLEILFEMPLASAEEVFRRTYLAWKFRKWAGNLSWVAHETNFSKRGLLKAAKDVGLHDGDQIVLPQYQPWPLAQPQRRREHLWLQVSLPSSSGWLKLIEHKRGDVEAARALLLNLLHGHAATTVEAALAKQVRRDECDPAALARALARSGAPRSTP